ncbi:MAG: SDR family NAD(P)-dependent oxidoreductase, partial [Simkania negevensis]|nr:SDR family NAD(P)-dependent oxidoreductase [Simkania negevensis]
MDQKKVLITGAARGLGKEIKIFLAERDFFIYGTTRKLKDPSILEAHSKMLELDLSSKASIDALVDYLTKNENAIDYMIHNSGIAYLDPIDVLDEEEYRKMFEVNFFGPIYLTKQLIPLMKRAKKSKIIFISSIASVDHWPYLGGYAASKAALEAVAFESAVLFKKWGIDVSVIRPNPLPTDMQILRSKNALQSPHPELKKRKLEWETLEGVCDLIFKILNDPAPKFDYQTGEFSEKRVQQFHKKNCYQK